MEITFYGAAQEVGKSCIQLRSGSQRYLLDAGVKFIQGSVLYPEVLDGIRGVDAVFLSHAHMDHSGALPFLEHGKLDCPIYTTAMTWDIAHLLLEDAYHIAQLEKIHPVYKRRDIRRASRDAHQVRYDQWYHTPDHAVRFRYINAGHIPGSASILLEVDGKRIFYTGDINTQDTLLMKPATPETELAALGVSAQNPLDVMIVETTYGNREHPDRAQTRARFVAAVEAGLARGGTVLIPAFGVGRAQEVLLMLADLPAHVPIYLDGMARKIAKLILATQDPYVRATDALARVMRRVIAVNRHMREVIATEPGAVIVSTSGMIQGGPSVYYTERLHSRADATIILTGYQVEGTRGRSLWEDHLFYRHGTALPVQCAVEKFDFSAHYGMGAIHALIESVPHRHLVLQHGDHGALDAVARYARSLNRVQVHVPALEQVMTF